MPAFNDEMTTQTSTRARGQLILSKVAWRTIAKSLQLSHREFQIARALFDDEKELCIARELGISKHTVNTYLQRLYQKLQVSSRVQLVVRLVGEHLALWNSADQRPNRRTGTKS